jgi:hypothetical protein
VAGVPRPHKEGQGEGQGEEEAVAGWERRGVGGSARATWICQMTALWVSASGWWTRSGGCGGGAAASLNHEARGAGLYHQGQLFRAILPVSYSCVCV